MDNTEKHYTVHQLADMLNISYMTAYRLVTDLKIESFKVGQQIRVSDKAYQEFKERNKVV